jgi:CDP-paratose 2-epimerase
MRILITGICGFAGSVIARGLLEHLPGVRITGIDSLIRRGSETNLEFLRTLGIEVRIGDIRNEQDLSSLPGVDWVLDCAANPSVLAGVDGLTSAKELLDHNLGGSIHLLEYCRMHAAGFILLSTSRVYSIPPLASLTVEVDSDAFHPIPSTFCPMISEKGLTEQFSTEPPISLYGSSKKCSELLALEYGMTFDFPVRINRCGVLAGAGQFGKADQGIFSYWIHSWASRRPLKYIGFGGRGHQVRDCLHPRDIVPLLLAQMGDPSRNVPSVLNVSGGSLNAMSLAQLSSWCEDRFGCHEVGADTTPRPFDIPWMVLDSSGATAAWQWSPQTRIKEILEEIGNHAEKNPGWLDLVS